MTVVRKKLIEVSMPLEAINTASVREKSIRHGHPSTLHLWWARRPLAACRAVIFGQLVDDPSSWPDRFPTVAAQDAERERLHDVIREFVEWPPSAASERARWERALDAGRYEIARSLAWGRDEEPPNGRGPVLSYLAEHAPSVYDPFCGGGSIPLEAQRLGLRAYGSDLNPVPVLISKALVELPSKFAGLAPVNPAAGNDLLEQRRHGAQGLAEDVRYYGSWMREQAKSRFGDLYPDATLPDGRKATVIAWLWARTVRSPDPAAKDAMVPLAASYLLSSKTGKEAIVSLVRDQAAADGWRFKVKHGGATPDEIAEAEGGTKGARSNFTCALTGAAITGDWIRREARAGRLKARLMAIVAQGDRSRVYLDPDHLQETIALGVTTPARDLDIATSTHPQYMGCVGYGLDSFRKLFTDRQLLALTTYSDLVGEASARALVDAETRFRTRSLPLDPTPLSQGGRGPRAYADAVATYLGLAVSKLADAQSSLVRWRPTMDQAIATFGRQAMPMVWDYAESNIFNDMAGDFVVSLNNMMRVLTDLDPAQDAAIFQIDASANSYPVRPVVISTDPPYYDNIPYADLSDFFYVWLRRSLGGIWPDLFRRLQTPKHEELVADLKRHGGREAAHEHFMAGMRRSIGAMRSASIPGVPLTIYYAFKQSELEEEGISSAGWASFLQAVIDSGLMVDGTWPIRTERSNRMRSLESNALASSIVLVCRPRPDDTRTTTRRDFVAELRRELPEALAMMRAARVHPVDIPQSALGPGMAVFSKYAVVREADDSAMSVSRAIALINQVRGEIDHADAGDLDTPTRFALDWFASYGWGAKDSGEAIKLAQSYDLTERQLRDTGVLLTERGEARLVRRGEMQEDWRPSRDRTLTAWELAQALNRALNDGGGVSAAGSLLAEARGLSVDALWLARRLFDIAEDRRLSDEARGWGRLSEAWDAIEAAADRAGEPTLTSIQPRLI